MKPKKDRKKLIASIGKIVVATVLVVGIIPAIFMVRVKDSLQNPSYCATCHEAPHFISWKETDTEALAYAHYQSSISCQTCHDRTLGQAMEEIRIYNEDYLRNTGFGERIGSLLNLFDDDINESVFLLQTEMGDQFCKNCHTDDSARIAATENFTIEQNLAPEIIAKLVETGNESLVDGGPVTINPHNYPVDKENINDPHGESASLPECSECHYMHQESPEIEYCFTCHHSRLLVPCSTCHEGEPGADTAN